MCVCVCEGLAPSLIAQQQLHSPFLVPLRALRTAPAPSLQVCPTPLFSSRVYVTVRTCGCLVPVHFASRCHQVRRIVSVHSFRLEDLEREFMGKIAAVEQQYVPRVLCISLADF